MKKTLLIFILFASSAVSAITISPPYIADDYESDEVYQVCGSAATDKSYTCSLINKVEYVVKPDGRVITGEMQIKFAPDDKGTMLGTIILNQQITVDCKIKNISYGSDADGWSAWTYLGPNTVGHKLMEKVCTLGK